MKRKHWILLGLLFLVWLDWFIRAPDSQARDLTAAIQKQGSEQLKAYPYQFHVLRVKDGVAYLSTPRDVEVPAGRALSALFPDLNTKDSNNPAFIAAQEKLGQVQSEARVIVHSQPGVKDVRWELDKEWLAAHFIDLPERR